MAEKKTTKKKTEKVTKGKSKKKRKLASARPAKAKKKTVKKVAKAVKEVKEKKKPVGRLGKYYEAVGRRKTSVARIRIWSKGEGEFLINQKPLKDYFQTPTLQKVALDSLEQMKSAEKFKVSVVVKGGGISSQAEAVRHGTARALVLFNPDFRKKLKKAGYLMRDPRMKERKKFGLKGARRAPQWQKR
jgi:small subunit ribosomal protein S9